jgi:hypothetical protein
VVFELMTLPGGGMDEASEGRGEEGRGVYYRDDDRDRLL